jgi:hypothetical protein
MPTSPARAGRRGRLAALAVALGALAAAGPAAAQTARPAPAAPPAPVPIGARAPEFSLPAVTRYGPLARPVTTADFLGKTLVIAFFYQARTKG